MGSVVGVHDARLVRCSSRTWRGVSAADEVAVIRPTGVVVDKPGIDLGAELPESIGWVPVNVGRQHSCNAVPWNRSHTALWFGDRGGVR